ncbi:MAG: type III secretion system inner membrane ring lipoprotein SctJ [Janthinobacterium lividum]
MSSPILNPALARGGTSWRCLALVCLLLLLGACEKDRLLLGDISARDATEIQSVLSDANIDAIRDVGKEGTVDLRVLPEHQVEARRILRERGLPRPSIDSLVDVFGKDNIISSPFEEKVRYLYAISQGLEDTLRNIDGVVVAKVHIVMPEKSTLGNAALHPSASVFIKYRPVADLPAFAPSIQRLVANAIPALSPERVAVVTSQADDLDSQSMASAGRDNIIGAAHAKFADAGWLIAAFIAGISLTCFARAMHVDRPMRRWREACRSFFARARRASTARAGGKQP